MRILPAAAAVALLAGTILTGTPAQAHNDGDRIAKQRELLNSDQNIPLTSSNNVSLASSNPSSPWPRATRPRPASPGAS